MKFDVLDILTLVVGGINLGFVLRLMYNHLEHIQADLKELRAMFIDHLIDHGDKK